MIAFHALQILGEGFGGERKTQKPRVLFLSTGDATRSLIAEGFLRTLTNSRFDVASAGVEPSALNPLASEVMKEAGIDISGQRPQRVAQSLRAVSAT